MLHLYADVTPETLQRAAVTGPTVKNKTYSYSEWISQESAPYNNYKTVIHFSLSRSHKNTL